MTIMHGLPSAKIAVAIAAVALVIVGCTAGTDTHYVTAGFQDQPPADPLQDGLTGTPQSGDPAPIVEGLTAPTTSPQTGGQTNGQGNGQGQTPSGKDGGG